MSLPKAMQHVVDAVTEQRRQSVQVIHTNWCAYNDYNIRVAVIFPHPEGQWAIAGRVVNPWASFHEQKLEQFTLEAAKAAVTTRIAAPLHWIAEDVPQPMHEDSGDVFNEVRR